MYLYIQKNQIWLLFYNRFDALFNRGYGGQYLYCTVMVLLQQVSKPVNAMLFIINY